MAEIKPKLERLLGDWEPGITPTKNVTEVGLRDAEQVYLIDRPGSEQSIIFAGNIAPAVSEGNELAVETMNEIIGGSFTSRINMNLRALVLNSNPNMSLCTASMRDRYPK